MYQRIIPVAGLLTVGLISGCQTLPQAPDAQVGDGWSLVWHDEFSGQTIDREKWGFETNCWGGGNNELQCYTDRPDNAFIRDGKLVIRAQEESFTGPAEPLEWESEAGETTLPYTSARLRTLNKGDWTYGRIEVRARIPGGQGVWPAIWMLPTDWVYGGWASSGEIDIMEAVNLGGDEMAVHGTLHYGSDWPNNVSSGASYTFGDSDPTEDFHTYAIEWANGEIRWYVDDVHYATQRESGWYSQSPNADGEVVNYPGAAPFDQRFHLLMNVAIGGNWPGNPDETTELPVEMEVDYVRVYECPSARESLITCATKNRKAERVFGHQPPVISDAEIEFDPTLTEQDTVTIYGDEALPPFAFGQYVANGSVLMTELSEEDRGQVTQVQFNTDESVVYWQAPVGFDFSEFATVSFDMKIVSDLRESGGMIMKVDCFHPCSSGEVPFETAPVGEWRHYEFVLDDLLANPGSTLDLSNVNTPLVVSPDWGNQQGVVILLDNVVWSR
ncbi:glycoside hydrolase family 16 protein [Reinekea blandensis]|uniref:GH16 domain-containing protein n=1 Tax=Reinekea blandensis MED297 TaxID=314283 RepID=A4BA43_9GAMM|nr:glycoside hydrolase family 16 protein [Reinekea blandensis]EAR10799.1 hypothetical protein MED297_09826 [Reinekea sp. MED297] [Reinekea blandensis MED297]